MRRYGGFPSPLAGESGAKRRMRGLYRHTKMWRDTPHPSELVSAGVAVLSHKGQGTSMRIAVVRLARSVTPPRESVAG
jgi:hypothetical protein